MLFFVILFFVPVFLSFFIFWHLLSCMFLLFVFIVICYYFFFYFVYILFVCFHSETKVANIGFGGGESRSDFFFLFRTWKEKNREICQIQKFSMWSKSIFWNFGAHTRTIARENPPKTVFFYQKLPSFFNYSFIYQCMDFWRRHHLRF